MARRIADSARQRRRIGCGLSAMMALACMTSSTSPRSAPGSSAAQDERAGAAAAGFEIVVDGPNDAENTSAGGGFELISVDHERQAERLEGDGLSLTGMIMPEWGESSGGDADDALHADDLLQFLECAAHERDSGRADLDGDGMITGGDVVAFVDGWRWSFSLR